MKFLTIETMIPDDVAKKYMSLPLIERAGYIQSLVRQGKFRLADFTTELEGEFPDSNFGDAFEKYLNEQNIKKVAPPNENV